eukprot:06775.XXX_389737_389871_1 [CDS] Oithona nana genome sequencing.
MLRRICVEKLAFFHAKYLCVYVVPKKINSFDMLYDPSKCMCKWFF